MLRVLILLVIAGFLVTGCAGVDVYTFKKDRVDQEIKGNEGYLTGQADGTPLKERKTERTLIGVDIELTGPGAWKKEGTEIVPEPVEAVRPVEAARTEVKKIEPERAGTAKDGTAEDWIK